MQKIYTKIGDQGFTVLGNGQRTEKSSIRIEAYGGLDELNCHVGWLRETVRSSLRMEPVDSQLQSIQNELFELGGELALATGPSGVALDSVARLEEEMDSMSRELSPLRSFVLPGGSLANAAAHMCRTVTRRVERAIVRLNDDDQSVRPEVLVYMNRLSDWFFVLARFLAHRSQSEEILWAPKVRAP